MLFFSNCSKRSFKVSSFIHSSRGVIIMRLGSAHLSMKWRKKLLFNINIFTYFFRGFCFELKSIFLPIKRKSILGLTFLIVALCKLGKTFIILATTEGSHLSRVTKYEDKLWSSSISFLSFQYSWIWLQEFGFQYIFIIENDLACFTF